MARLPVLHKRRPSKTDRALDLAKSAATVWTTLKASSASARAAKKGAKVYGAAKGARVAGRSVAKLLAVPAAVAGGVAIWRAAHRGADDDAAHVHEQEHRPLGPVARADTLTPPASASEAAAQSEAHASS